MNAARGHLRLRRFVLGELSRRRAGIATAFASLLGAIAMDLLAPWPVKIVVDHVLLAKPFSGSLEPFEVLRALGTTTTLAVLAAAIAGIALASGAFAYLQTFLSARIGHELVYALRRELFSHLQRLSLSFHRRSATGDLLTKVATDTNLIRDALSDWAVKAVAEVLLIVGVLGVMFAMNWRLALVVLGTLPLLFVLMWHLNRKIRLSARAQRRSEGRLVSRLNEVLSSVALVQAFGRETYEQARFDLESTQSLEAGVASARTSAAVSKAVGMVAALGLAATVFVGGGFAVAGTLTPGELLIFMAYVGSLFKPIRDLGKLSAKFSRARVGAERIADILALEPDIHDRPDARPATSLRGDIAFEHVTFTYETGKPVLDDVSLRIRAGEHVALVGASGTGKSTLVSMVLRLQDPVAGTVRIDGEAVDMFTRDSLRQRIGIVLQDAILSGASVRENIAYGRPEASLTEIEDAARQASAHGFIVALPDGYDTIVGERGGTLSGGQRQRICLARTLIKNPDILILDEPTSAVDAFTAGVIHQVIATQRHGRTTIVIGHQFATLAGFDRVLELEGGRIHDVTARFRAAASVDSAFEANVTSGRSGS